MENLEYTPDKEQTLKKPTRIRRVSLLKNLLMSTELEILLIQTFYDTNEIGIGLSIENRG